MSKLFSFKTDTGSNIYPFKSRPLIRRELAHRRASRKLQELSPLSCQNQTTVSSLDSLSTIRKYIRTNSPLVNCIVWWLYDWEDCLSEQHRISYIRRSWKTVIYSSFFWFQENKWTKSTPPDNLSTRAITEINWQVLGLTADSRRRSWSSPC